MRMRFFLKYLLITNIEVLKIPTDSNQKWSLFGANRMLRFFFFGLGSYQIFVNDGIS